MMSKQTEKKKTTQSKLSFYDILFTKPAPKVTEKTKDTTIKDKDTSQNDVNNKNLILFPENNTASDMEVDTNVTKQPESEAESSTANTATVITTTNVDEDPEL